MDLLGWLWDFLLVDPMTNVLVGLARVFGGNFGIAIIVFTILMKFLTWPLTSSQYKQSRAMQELQPRMQELQKKYKGKDPKKLQQETMALYREAGVNPLGCLLPMLVQFPIWIALYQVINRSLGNTPESLVGLSQQLYPITFLRTAIPLNNQFLIWDLGAADATLLLPILVGVTMYVQQKMIIPRPPPGKLTQQQLQQQQTQQMMTWMLPLMFLFWSLNVPAGLALYWLISNVAGIVLQYFYLGRKVDWGGMLRLGPPQAEDPRKSQRPAAALVDEPKQGRAAADEQAEDEAAPEETEDQVAAVSAGGAQSRRKRNGRRRGKR
jgi:YidC/Oxa1 family membrane protein insertase